MAGGVAVWTVIFLVVVSVRNTNPFVHRLLKQATDVLGQATSIVGVHDTAHGIINGANAVAKSMLNTASVVANDAVDKASGVLQTAGTVAGGVLYLAGGAVDSAAGVILDTTVIAGGFLYNATNVAGNAVSSATGLGFKIARAALGSALTATADLITSGARAAAPAITTLPQVITDTAGMALALGNGFLKNAANIWRSGPLNVSLSGMMLSVEIPLLLTDVYAGYENVKFSSWFFKTSGSASLNFPMTRLNITLEVSLGIQCWLNIRGITLGDLAKPEVNLDTDCSVCQAAVDAVGPLLIEVLLPDLRVTIEEGIESAVTSVLPSAGSIICGALNRSQSP